MFFSEKVGGMKPGYLWGWQSSCSHSCHCRGRGLTVAVFGAVHGVSVQTGLCSGFLYVLPHHPAVVGPDIGAREIVGVQWNTASCEHLDVRAASPSVHKEETSLSGRMLSCFFASVAWNVYLPNEKLFFCSWEST